MPPPERAGSLDPLVRHGVIVPYHSVSAARIRHSTAEHLLLAGIAEPLPHTTAPPSTPLAAASPACPLGASVTFSPTSRRLLPTILGGDASRGAFDLDPVMLDATVTLVSASPSRVNLTQTMIRDDLGFATPRFPTPGINVTGRSPQRVAQMRLSSPPKPRVRASPLKPISKKADQGALPEELDLASLAAALDTSADEDLDASARISGKDEQSHILGYIANQATADEAVSTLARIRSRFRLISGAIYTALKLPAFRPKPQAFPPSVLAEAARSARLQESAYDILRKSALAEASLAGQSGTTSALQLGADFDQACADAITDGSFTLDLDPLELLLGVLPIYQLALYIWFREHRPSRHTGRTLESATDGLDFLHDGIFDPITRLQAFATTYSTVVADEEAYNTDYVMEGIVAAVARSLPGSNALRIDTGAGAQSWESWGNDLIERHHAITKSPPADGTYVYTRPVLHATVRLLQRFARRHGDMLDAGLAIRQPTAAVRAAGSASLLGLVAGLPTPTSVTPPSPPAPSVSVAAIESVLAAAMDSMTSANRAAMESMTSVLTEWNAAAGTAGAAGASRRKGKGKGKGQGAHASVSVVRVVGLAVSPTVPTARSPAPGSPPPPRRHRVGRLLLR